jgi:PAS domain S-box-containing protein
MRLSTRLNVAMMGLVLLTATAIGLLGYRNSIELALPHALDRIDTQARVTAAVLEASIRGARTDVLSFRSTAAVDGFVRASLGGGVQPLDGTTEAQWRDKVASRFLAELAAKPGYSQFRLIGIADGGRELVRVDRAGPDGTIRVAPATELQREGEQEYFKKTIQLSPSEVYVSPIDLAKERGAIEIPYVPTLRAAAPVFAPDDTLFGMVIINVDLRPIFAHIRAIDRGAGQVYLLSERGDYLLHPNSAREFGFEFGRPARFQDDFPEIAEFLALTDVAPRIIRDRTGARFAVGSESVWLAGGPRITVIETTPYAQVVAAAAAVRDASLLGGLAAILGAIALAVVLARSLTRPLVEMTKAVEGFARGEPILFPTRPGGEIGVLADAFMRMATETREKTAALTNEIQQRRRIFETSVDLILVTDRKGNVVQVSPSVSRILGYLPEEMIGRGTAEFVYSDDLDPTRDEVRRARRGREIRYFDTRYVHKDGRVVALAWSGVWSEPEQQYYFIGRDMTERHAAEQALRKSEQQLKEQGERLETALNSMRQGFVMFDSEGRLVLCNQQYLQMYGLAPETVHAGCTLREILQLRKAAGTFAGDPDQYVVDQLDRWKTRVREIDLPDGRIIAINNGPAPGGGWVATHDDITQRRLAEREHDRTRAFLDTVIENVPATLVVKEAREYRYVLVNRHGEQFFRMSRDKMIGKNAYDFFPQAEAEIITAHDNEALRSKQELVIENASVRTPHIGTRLITTKRLALRDHDGEPQYLLSFIDDVTERRRAEEALRDSEQMARRIIDTALDAFVQMDEAGNIIEWNPQAEAIFGWSRQEVVGKSLGEIIVPDDHRAAHQAGLARFLRTGEGVILGKRLELEAVRRDGSRIKIELSVTALRRSTGYVFNGFLRDITQKLATEQQFRQAQKMEAVGQLTGGIAHDFNNMLTVIMGTSEILTQELEGKPELAALANMIDQAAQRGADLTERLLAYARKQPLRPQQTDINTLVAESAKLLRSTLGENIELETRLADDLSQALVDPSQLSSALVNLGLNARDAMPDGGKLMLETGNVLLDEGYVSAHKDVQPGSYVMVAVSDTGTGMPTAIRDRVFEPFFTTKESGKGTGLGLSMVYGFVKQSGGHIKIYSEVGSGTIIKLYLPRANAETGKGERVAEAHVEGGSETILLVEDNELVREQVSSQLQTLGYTTIAAANGVEALTLLDQGASANLLFTDIIMPGGMNGRQLADEVMKRRPSIRVLYTSGYTENAMIHQGRLEAGVLLLAKPYRKSDLARMIRLALAGHQDADENAQDSGRKPAGLADRTA